MCARARWPSYPWVCSATAVAPSGRRTIAPHADRNDRPHAARRCDRARQAARCTDAPSRLRHRPRSHRQPGDRRAPRSELRATPDHAPDPHRSARRTRTTPHALSSRTSFRRSSSERDRRRHALGAVATRAVRCGSRSITHRAHSRAPHAHRSGSAAPQGQYAHRTTHRRSGAAPERSARSGTTVPRRHASCQQGFRMNTPAFRSLHAPPRAALALCLALALPGAALAQEAATCLLLFCIP